MLKSIGTGYSGIKSQQEMLDVTSHNLANLQSTGYKEKQTSFQELYYRNIDERRLPRAGNPPVPPQSSRGTTLSSVVPSRVQGMPEQTGRPFDLCIVGEGFFRIVTPEGDYAYTRSGHFTADEEGNLVMPDGGGQLDIPVNLLELEEEGLDPESLVISRDGTLTARERGAEQEPAPEEQEEGEFPPGTVEVGQLQTYRFINPQSLSEEGGNRYRETEMSGPPQESIPGEDGAGVIEQGCLEASNVDLSRQMSTLLRGQRALQASARSVLTSDELWAVTLNLRS